MEHEYNPLELSFEECMAPAEYRYQQIVTMLEDYVCIVDFKKVNGELRSMPCTLREDHMPVSAQVIKDDIDLKPNNYETITVWCTDKSAWRAMKTHNVISVKIAPKRWTATVEDDPETGELLLPLPPDLLVNLGWNEGDTLDWHDNGDGSWSLSKVSISKV